MIFTREKLISRYGSDFDKIYIIDLSDEENKIIKIDSDTFDGLNELCQIVLDNNLIIDIELNTFNSLDSLTRLSLGNNKLSSINYKLFKQIFSKNFKSIIS